ncbi:MAG: hypothetical protein HUU47_10300 [Bacteroidetes bacterium]|nr:hypothetical protein [Bacteroidota bacterium]
MKRQSLILFFIFSILMHNCFALYIYKPKPGDKFTYRISKNNKINEAVFIYDNNENSTTFYWKLGNEDTKWGKANLSDKNIVCFSTALDDSTINKNCNFIYLSKESFKLFKSKKKINAIIDNSKAVFSHSKTEDYIFPVSGAEFKFKLITVTSTDKRYSISFIDNAEFPVIVSLIAEAAWQLQSVVPLPMYPITFDITGKTIFDKSVSIFKKYIQGTCINFKVEYNENYKTIAFDEYFCPITGIRYTLKNDTIVSVVLVGKNENSNDLIWNSYKGYFWGVYSLGISKKIIVELIGKADKIENGKHFYSNRGFYLIFDSDDKLDSVEYE